MKVGFIERVIGIEKFAANDVTSFELFKSVFEVFSVVYDAIKDSTFEDILEVELIPLIFCHYK